MTINTGMDLVNEIRELGVKGYSKEEVSKKLNVPIWKVGGVMSVLGFGRAFKNVFEDQPRMMNEQGEVKFTVPKGVREEIGMVEGFRYTFTAKTLNKQVVLTFKKE